MLGLLGFRVWGLVKGLPSDMPENNLPLNPKRIALEHVQNSRGLVGG